MCCCGSGNIEQCTSRTWTVDDFVRAHRVGQGREGQPRPMIARFSRWRDKLHVLKNRELRDKLKESGVNVATDYTRLQASIVAQARREGRTFFFRNGVMEIGPVRPDPRSYAQVTAAGSSGDPGVSSADTRQHGEGGVTSPQQHGRGEGRRSEVNTRKDSSRDSRSTSRAVRREEGGGGGGLSTSTVCRSPVYPRAGVGEGGGVFRDMNSSLCSQLDRGAEGDSGIPAGDVTGRQSGPVVGSQAVYTEGRGDGSFSRSQTTEQQSVRSDSGRAYSTSTNRVCTDRRASVTRQTGLRNYLGNQGGNRAAQRSLRSSKSK